MTEYPKEFLDLLESVTAKRPRTVIQHILKNGYITSEELKDVYGYNHPPRAVRDVREYGIPLVTYRVQGSDKLQHINLATLMRRKMHYRKQQDELFYQKH